MFPIILNPSELKFLLIGNGVATERRRKSLEDVGIVDYVHLPLPPAGMVDETISEGAQSNCGGKFADADIIFIADFDYETSQQIYEQAKATGALVNVEDKTKLCDFHVPAIVRRGDLLLTSSTGGASPRLSRKIKEELEELFGEEWTERTEVIKQLRSKWKEENADFEEISEKTDDLFEKEGWFEK